MITIYENSKQSQYFYFNQQNMSNFNENNLLVSYNSIFTNKIIFYIFDINNNYKISENRY
jgi:hypothetical protein